MHARPVSSCEINLTSLALVNRFSRQLARPTVLTPPWNEPNWFSLRQFHQTRRADVVISSSMSALLTSGCRSTRSARPYPGRESGRRKPSEHPNRADNRGAAALEAPDAAGM